MDIGAERTLASIQRADLFGGGLEKEASRLVATLRLAKQNGASEHELLEAITRLAFYAGRPEAMSANTSAKEVFGTKPADWFAGDVWFDIIYRGEESSRARAWVVKFVPATRTHWHPHGLGPDGRPIERAGRA